MNESDSMINARSKGYRVDLQSTLEELDPKDKYIGTDLEGLDALDRQLRRFCMPRRELQTEILS